MNARFIRLLLLIPFLIIAQPAWATDWMIETKITAIEPTYIPLKISFWTESGAGSCPAGSIYNWNAQGADQPAKIANVQSVLATLMTALMTGKRVRLYGNNAACGIEFIHLLSN